MSLMQGKDAHDPGGRVFGGTHFFRHVTQFPAPDW